MSVHNEQQNISDAELSNELFIIIFVWESVHSDAKYVHFTEEANIIKALKLSYE